MIVFIVGKTHCQNQVTYAATPLELTGNLQKGFITSYSSSNTVYFVDKYPGKEQRVLYSIDQQNKLDSSSFIKSKHLKKFKTERVMSFVVKQDKLLVLTNGAIYQFSKTTSNNWKYEASTTNKYGFYSMLDVGEELLLEVCYPFHNSSGKADNLWAKYDLKTNTITSFHTPEIDNSLFACFVNSWISTSNGIIAHASTSTYHIGFYNADFKLIDSIVCDSAYVSSIARSEVDHFDLDSKEGVSEFSSFDKKTYSRIRKIFLMDSTHLVVLIRKKEVEDGLDKLDFWEKEQGKWHLSSSQNVDLMYKKGQPYNDSIFSMNGLYQNMQSLTIVNHSIVRIFCPFYHLNTESFDRKKDIDAKIGGNSTINYGMERFTFLLD